MSDLSRWENDRGEWATFRTTYGWLAWVRIQAAAIDGGGALAFFRTLVVETLIGWRVLAADGTTWLDAMDDAAFEAVDAYTGQQVLDRCNDIWRAWQKAAPDPKDTRPRSSASPPA